MGRVVDVGKSKSLLVNTEFMYFESNNNKYSNIVTTRASTSGP